MNLEQGINQDPKYYKKLNTQQYVAMRKEALNENCKHKFSFAVMSLFLLSSLYRLLLEGKNGKQRTRIMFFA
jgi:hypothetical protein